MKNEALIPALFIFTGSLFAAKTKVTKEDRHKMSEMHSKMAACLKSDKPNLSSKFNAALSIPSQGFCLPQSQKEVE